MNRRARRKISSIIEKLEIRALLSTYHVDIQSTGRPASGANWEYAFTDLRTALSVASSGDIIKVADGTYKPTTSANRALTFNLKNGVGIYGGYAGYGASDPEARDTTLYPTILSGDVGTIGVNTDNSFNVVTATSVDSSTVLDGLTITLGYAGGYDTNQGNGAGIIVLSNSSPTLNNCIISNNTSLTGNGNGGGMYNAPSSSPTLSHCTFIDNSSSNTYGGGGGIYNDSSSPTISDCTFITNSCRFGSGGGIYNFSSSPNITNCVFSQNTARTGGGAYNASCSPTYSNCTFSKNSVTTSTDFIPSSGGGMYNASASPTLSHCVFSENSATAQASSTKSYGGGMYNSSSSPTLTYCTFTGNSASIPFTSSSSFGGGMYNASNSSPTLNNCDFSGNTAFNCGAIYSLSSSLTGSNCTFTGNTGNTIGGFYFESSSMNLSHCDFIGNSGYAMYNSASTTAVLSNCTFARNANGGIYNTYSSPILTNCWFSGNSGSGVINDHSSPSIVNCAFVGNRASKAGGMYNTYSSPNLINCTFVSNTNANDYSYGGIYNENSSPNLVNCILWSNGVFFSNSYSTPTLANCDIEGGYDGTGNINADPRFVRTPWPGPDGVWTTSDDDYGDLRLRSGSPCLNGGLNSVNTSVADLAGNPRIQDGVIDIGALEGGVVVAPKTHFVDCNAVGSNDGSSWVNAFISLQSAIAAAVDGDTIKVADGTYKPTTTTDRTISFVLRNAVSILGGFAGFGAADPDARNVTLYPSILSGDIGTIGTNNDNSYHVVVTMLARSSTVLDGLTVTLGNANASNVSNGTNGGGMLNFFNSCPTLNNCIFTGNNSSVSGGGIFNCWSSSPILTDCAFIQNSSNYGGGMHNTGGSSPLLTRCSFTNNSVYTFGGGMYNERNSSPVLNNCTFTGNSAASGGGVYGERDASPVLNNCAFTNNTARGTGGGISNQWSSAVLTNCTFTGNYANSGGGMYNFSSPYPTAINCVFVANEASKGGGVYNASSSAVFTNCTWVSNSASNGSGGIYNENASPILTNCILWTNGISITNSSSTPTLTNCDVEGGYAGTSNINADPRFVRTPWVGPDGVWRTADDDYGDPRLQSGSPCLNGGLNSANTSVADAAGNPRIQDGVIDIGALEGSGVVVASKTFFVDCNAVGSNDGSTWTNAFVSLHSAIAIAVDGDTIKVADGTYKPTATADRTISFVLRNAVSILGGFAGFGAADPDARDIGLYPTILSGDIGTVGTTADNSYNVVKACVIGSSTLLDGVTVTLGYFGSSTTNGGGMLNTCSSPTLNNCKFTGNSSNYGGGIYNSYSSPTITNSRFIGNTASSYDGGGIYNSYSSPIFTNCVFTGNKARSGGGIYNSYSSATLTNCQFNGNTAYTSGGGMYNFYTPSSSATNCTFVANDAPSGGGVYNGRSSAVFTNCTWVSNSATKDSGGFCVDNSSPILVNCILWSNGTSINRDSGTPNISYSDIEGGFGGTGNINAIPCIVRTPWVGPDGVWRTADDDYGDLRLKSGSPCLNSGLSSANTPATDIAGNPRIQDGVIDIGAYEGVVLTPPRTLYVDCNAVGSNNGSSWANAFVSLQLAIAASADGDTIKIADGTYKPTTTTDRTISYVLRNAVSIYGGYRGYGSPDPDQRDIAAYRTILSGDIGTAGSTTDNSYHVVYATFIGMSVLMDGITITQGKANGSGTNYNCGSGMLILNSQGLTLARCTFIDNASEKGTLYISSSSASLSACVFFRNSSSTDGGALYNTSSSIIISSSVFISNSASSGAAIFNSNTTQSRLINCTLYGNLSSYGGAVYNYSSSSSALANCILWNNGANAVYNNGGTSTVEYCDVEGGYTGAGNVNVEPMIVKAPWQGPDLTWGMADDDAGDYRLRSVSPLINAGNSAAVVDALDVAGNTRIQDSAVDIGACEGGVVFVPQTLYVDCNAVGIGDGSTWANAFKTLQPAIAAAREGDLIKVADGTYKPTTTTDRTVSITLRSQVTIQGGYAGYGAANPDARDLSAFPTILSGDIGTSGSNADNSYHIMAAAYLTVTVLEGLTFTQGNANGSNAKQNFGGAILAMSAGTLTINSCIFIYNTASSCGGAVYNIASTVNFNSCVAQQNTATSGGVIYNNSASSKFANCTLILNRAPSGSISSNYLSTSTLVNSIALFNDTPLFNNSTTKSTTSVSYSNIQGGYAGTGNVNVDPGFVRTPWIGADGVWNTPDDDLGDLRLKAGSALINAGLSSEVTTTLDLSGNDRIVDSSVDIGAYEGFVTTTPKTLYVDLNATGANNGSSWANAFTRLQSAITAAADGDVIKIADGTYKPTTTTDRSISFVLRGGVSIYGGYAGFGASDPDARNVVNTPTILSGDIGTVGNQSDNSYHVVYANGVISSAILDGVTITQGNANGTGTNQNLGSAICEFNFSYLKINACSFYYNNSSAGTVFIDISASDFTNCRFVANTASMGTGIYASQASFTLLNSSLFSNFGSSAIAGATGAYFSAIPTVKNTIIWNSGSVSMSVDGSANDFQGTYSYGSINADPQFVRSPWIGNDGLWGTADDDYGDLTLREGSRALNAGQNSAVTTPTDLAGNARIQGDNVDMGAIESGNGAAGAKNVYVDVNASGAADGSSWANAFTRLQSAIAASNDGDAILMADGTYLPTTTGDRALSFIPRNNQTLKGGYAGYGAADPNERNYETYPTILSGNIGSTTTADDDSYHVVSLYNNSASLDGVTIAYGNANGTGSNANGGGVFVNKGNLTLKNSKVIQNYASNWGGGVYATNSTLYLYNSVIASNFALSQGGGIYSFASTLNAVNIDLAFNLSQTGGGAALLTTSTLNITNSIVWDNSADSSDQIYNISSTLTATYCDIKGSVTGTGNISTSPMFVRSAWAGEDGVYGTLDDDAGDLRLRTGSPAVNAGSNIASTTPKDLDGNDRIQNTTVDIGAYEGTVDVNAKTIYVDLNATGANDGSSWANAFTNLQSALRASFNGDQIRMADGTYKPTTGSLRTCSFVLRNGVSIYGGYAGSGAANPDAHNVLLYPTILSGDIGTPDLNTDNSYHVVECFGLDSGLIDGVSIVRGYAKGSTFIQNSGGGIYSLSSNFVVSNTQLLANTAGYGGGLYANAVITLANSILIGNAAQSGNGGGALVNSSSTFVNCNFWDNTSSGGGADLTATGGTITNSICWLDSSTQTRISGGVNILNSDIFNSSSSGNISSDPLFVRNPSKGSDGVWGTYDDDYGDLRLRANSPCIDTGSNLAAGLTSVTTDIAGNARIFDFPANAINEATVDMGAYEAVKTAYVSAGRPYAVILGQSIALAGSLVNTAPVDAFYQWDLDGDGEFDDATGLSPTFSTEGLSPQTRVIALKVAFGESDFDIASTTVTIFPTDIYVDVNATGLNTGADWNNAYTQLSTATASAKSGQIIHIADGVYYPTLSTDRSKSFAIYAACSLIGGYAGAGSPNPDERDTVLHPTIISGDIGVAGVSTDNSYRLFTNSSSATFDGLTFRDAYNPGGAGGAIYTSYPLTINNCTFVGNTSSGGSAIHSFNGAANITNSVFIGSSIYSMGSDTSIANCSFANVAVSVTAFSSIVSNCTFTNVGTAIYVSYKTAISNCLFTNGTAHAITTRNVSGTELITVANSRFINNTSTESGAVAELKKGISAQFTNCFFAGNSYAGSGLGASVALVESQSAGFTQCVFVGNANKSSACGAVIVNNSSTTLNQCTFASNLTGPASSAGGYALYKSAAATVSIVNTLIWNCDGGSLNGSDIAGISNSDLQGYSGAGAINSKPYFVRNTAPGTDGVWGSADDDYGDLRLQYGSPCVDVGQDSANTLEADFNGAKRRVDIPGVGTGIIDIGAYEVILPNSIYGSSNADVYTARVSDDGKYLQIWKSDSTAGAPQFKFELSPMSSLILDLGAGNDTLILDLTNGDRLPIALANIETVKLVGADATTSLSASASQLSINNTLFACDTTPQIQLSGPILKSLALADNAKVQLNANTLIVASGDANAIRQYLHNGAIGATPAILGSTTLAALDNSRLHKTQFAGQTLAAPFSQVLIQSATPGDSNLDGVVNNNDLLAIYANLGHANTGWLGGDLDQDGMVDLEDLAMVQSKLQTQTLQSAAKATVKSKSTSKPAVHKKTSLKKVSMKTTRTKHLSK